MKTTLAVWSIITEERIKKIHVNKDVDGQYGFKLFEIYGPAWKTKEIRKSRIKQKKIRGSLNCEKQKWFVVEN